MDVSVAVECLWFVDEAAVGVSLGPVAGGGVIRSPVEQVEPGGGVCEFAGVADEWVPVAGRGRDTEVGVFGEPGGLSGE